MDGLTFLLLIPNPHDLFRLPTPTPGLLVSPPRLNDGASTNRNWVLFGGFVGHDEVDFIV